MISINTIHNTLKGKLIVSCQALPEEPLHSSFIMGRMAKAAVQGGAIGIRANTPEDIREIRSQVDVPIIGIIKSVYPDSDVYITPTMKEVEALMQESSAVPEIIAIDATNRKRPNGETLIQFVQQIRETYPTVYLMADCASVGDAINAKALGFDFIGTTLVGYTKETASHKIEANDFEILRNILTHCPENVIAEGNIDTPEKLKRVIELGAFCAVVGSIITRPQCVTKKFTDVLA